MGNDISTSEKGLKIFSDSYAGDVSPLEAWEVLAGDERSVLVDVRTLPEWSFVGAPDLSEIGKQVIFLSWRSYPTMAINNDFCHQLTKVVADLEAKIFFICRSGHRSMDAAIEATKYGYKHCYNIAGGFEGDVNEHRQRAHRNGWKLYNLPWGQN